MGRLAAAWMTGASPRSRLAHSNVEHAIRPDSWQAWGTSGIGKQGSDVMQACKGRSSQQLSARAAS